MVETAEKFSLIRDAAHLLSTKAHEGGHGTICGLSSVESGFLNLSAPSFSDFDHKDLASLFVATDLFTRLEGPFWVNIRGLGLSYSIGLRQDCEEGLITFTLFKSTNIVGAFSKALELVRGTADGTIPLTQVDLDTSISGAIFSVVSREDTMQHAATHSCYDVFRKTDSGYNARSVSCSSNCIYSFLSFCDSTFSNSSRF